MKEIAARIKQALAEEEANVERSVFDVRLVPFVSFFAAEIDTKQKMMYYVNAGHPPPLVYADGRMSALAKGGVPLGVRAALPQLAKQTAPFPRGGMLVAFTDGICERTNGRGEQFGDNRLEKFVQHHAELSAPLFVEKLLDEAKSFGQGKELDDDALHMTWHAALCKLSRNFYRSRVVSFSEKALYLRASWSGIGFLGTESPRCNAVPYRTSPSQTNPETRYSWRRQDD